MKKPSFVILVFILFVFIQLSYAQEQAQPSVTEAGLKVVVAEGEALLGDDMPPAQGKAMARNNARRNALEQAVGVEVRGSTVLYNSDLISDLVKTATKGLIVKEEVIEETPKITGNQFSYYCKIRAYVKPINTEKRGSFSILKAGVFRPDKKSAMESPVFQDNDELQVSASANEDSYLHIFSVSQDGRVSKLFPNEFLKAELLHARETYVFPNDAYRSLGLRIRVKTPGKLSRALESVLVIATKEKIDLLPGKGDQEPMITDLMRELSEMAPSLWTEKTMGYEVRK
ncbi:MAG: DUF4384 domain-containing protein [Nitrospirae bacterium]|nr:DUF4384 domain-containing protein [Nitrospirota bacterium]